MASIDAFTKREQTISAVVTRANGTVEDLGIVSYWHRNPLKRLAWHLFGWTW